MLKENLHIEFKSRFSDAVIETISAFANTNGGKVYIGIDDNGIVVPGFQIKTETFQQWVNEIKNKTQPGIIPDVSEELFDGKSVAVIKLHEFPVKPVSFRGRYYKRVGNANHQLSPTEITNLNLQSLQLSWDAYIKPNKFIDDLDKLKVEKFIQKVRSSARFQLSGRWKQDLEKLKLIEGRNITNAAWLLFANDTIEYNFHLGRFKTPSLIIDDKILNGTLFEVVEEAMNYILSHIKVAYDITGKSTQRSEIFEYNTPQWLDQKYRLLS